MLHIQKCGVIIIHEKDDIKRYLIVYSKKSAKYGFPKGGREKSEPIDSTAERELYEETGYRIQIENFEWNTLSNFRIKNNFYFIIELQNDLHQYVIDDGIQDTNEILYKKWMTMEELIKLPINKKNFGLNHYIKSLNKTMS